MTKAELFTALADYPDDGEILLSVPNYPAIPIKSIIHPPDSGDDFAYIFAEEPR